MTEKTHKGILKNWVINNATDRPTVVGNVYGSPNFEDGEKVRTSYIVDLKGAVLETRNSIYTLDPPSEDL